ncbi:hypothetical protein F5144DRAFT_546427 [Chaetomium tenue]|uniref:Uncharacterized protein n=1 Tax=Chaetomium tenue TaxID=1854479 RepID=A0ACB7PAT7_9PEZI|nr:hypothetical protein F5144DRAFT_546427 [Chaetomium globosum]
MENHTHMVTDLAFSQESGSSATAEALSQQDADPAVLANPQETVPEVLVPDIAGNTTAETAFLKDSQAPTLVNDVTLDEDGDFFGAIRRHKIQRVVPLQGAVKPALSIPARTPAADTSPNPAGNKPPAELPLPNNPVNNGINPATISQGPFGIKRSNFLLKYNYSGKRRDNPKAVEPNTIGTLQKKSDKPTAKDSRKVPSSGVIDLTGIPENPDSPDNRLAPSSQKAKRRHLDDHGREKRHKSQRSSLERQKARRLLKDWGTSVSRSSASRRSKGSSQHRHRHRQNEGAKPQGQGQGQQASSQQPLPTPRPQPSQQPSKPLPEPPQAAGQLSRQGPAGQTPSPFLQPDRVPGQHNGINTTSQEKELINATKNRQAQAAPRAAPAPPPAPPPAAAPPTRRPPRPAAPANGTNLPATSQEDDVQLFRTYASKVPQKRSAQLVSGLPNSGNRNLERNAHRGASQRSEPLAPPQPTNRPSQLRPAPVANRQTDQPYIPPGPAGGRNRQISNLGQSRNIFQPKPTPRQSQYNHLLDQVMAPPGPPPFSQPSLNHPQPRAPAYLPPHRIQRQRSFDDDYPQPAIPPRESVSALEALGPDRTVIQYVVYRTPRFTVPSINTDEDEDEDQEQLIEKIKQAKAIRCSEHLSLQTANSQAAAYQDRPRKGVVGKSWAMVTADSSPSLTTTTTTSTTSPPNPNLPQPPREQPQPTPQDPPLLYTGRVTYLANAMQLFWVATETRDLGGAVMAGVAARDMGRAGGYSNLRVDRAGVQVYTRRSAGEETGDEDGGEAGDGEEAGNGEDSPRGNENEKGVESDEPGAAGTGGSNGGHDNTTESATILPSPSTGPEPNAQNPAVGTTQKGHQQRNQAEAESDSDTSDDSDDEAENNATTNLPPPPPPNPPTPPHPLANLHTTTTLHTTHTTLPSANRAALTTFLRLARPTNRAIEDHHHYRYEVEPDMTARFAEAGLGDEGCTAAAELEWDPPCWWWRW